MADPAGSTTETTASDTSTTSTEQTGVKTADWYETELTKVRQEAASQRVKKQEAVKAKEAELTSAFQAQLAESATALETAKTEAATYQNLVEKFKAAIAAEVPTDKLLAFVSKIDGTTPEELAEDAKRTKELFGGFANGTPATDPSQGRGTGSVSGDSGADAFAAFIKKSLSR